MHRRALNYSFRETETLIFNVEVRPEVISSKGGTSTLAYQDQINAWQQIASKVAAVSGVQRTAYDIRKKWSDMKSRVKLKAAKIAELREKDGDDQPSNLTLTCLEERVLVLIRSFCPDSINLGENLSPVVEKKQNELTEMSPDAMEQDNRQPKRCSENTLVQDLNEEPEEIASQSSNIAMTPRPQRNTKLQIVSFMKDASENGTFNKKRKIQKSSEDILINILETQRQLKDSHLQQVEEIRKMKEMLNRLVKVKEAKLKLKCIKHGLNFKSLIE